MKARRREHEARENRHVRKVEENSSSAPALDEDDLARSLAVEFGGAWCVERGNP